MHPLRLHLDLELPDHHFSKVLYLQIQMSTISQIFKSNIIRNSSMKRLSDGYKTTHFDQAKREGDWWALLLIRQRSAWKIKSMTCPAVLAGEWAGADGAMLRTCIMCSIEMLNHAHLLSFNERQSTVLFTKEVTDNSFVWDELTK